MNKWDTTTTARLIASGALEIGDGYRAKNEELSLEGLPFARAQNVNGGFRFADADHYPIAEIGRVGRKVSEPGDCVITTKGSVGRVAFVTPDVERFVYSPQLSYWRSLDHEAVAPRFLRYWLQGPEFLAQCAAVKGATDMADYVNLRDQRRLQITLPTPAEQRRIGDVLAAIDELIENNRRRIALLEQMAQTIYREWFVHFRYPGHENDELVDSPLGPIPAGWGVRRVQDVAKIVRGRSYRKHELVDEGGVPFINLKCMERGGGFRRDGLKRYAGPFKPEQVTRPGDIVLAVTDLTQQREILARATRVPRLSEPEGVISLDVARVVPISADDRVPLLAILRYSDLADRVKEFANGSTVLHLSPDHVAASGIVWPTEQLRTAMAEVFGAAYEMADELSEAADRLASLRDLLLPRLVTGAIDVSHLDLDALLLEQTAA